MAKQFPGFEPAHETFIGQQHVFFVATAAPDGQVNLSPQGARLAARAGPPTGSHGAT
jgi:predicted pyridoxine 5'-phosphate oxidase superfamily flavin-nucleotide-binding protein